MNQSKYHNLPFYFIIFIFTLAFGWLELPELVAGIKSDSIAILSLIGKSPDSWAQTSDWHELLFVYEGRCLLQALMFLFPNIEAFMSEYVLSIALACGIKKQMIDELANYDITFTMVFLMYAMWGLAVFVMYVMLCNLFLSMKKNQCRLFFFLFFVLLSFVFIRHYNYARFYKYLDGFFCSYFVSAVIGVRMCYLSKGKKRLFWLLAVLFCLFHCLGYRRVAILSLPIVFYGVMPIIFRVKTVFRRVLAACACSLCFGAGSLYAISLFPATHAHSAVVMMYSDMTMTGLLSGDWDSLQTQFRKEGYYGIRNVRKDHPNVTLSQIYTGFKLPKPDSQEQWNRFVRMYIEYAMKYPKEMALSKMVSLIQFYSNFHVPQFVRNFVESVCPKAQLVEKHWNVKPVQMHDTGGSYEKVYLFLIAGSLLVVLFRYRKHLDAEMRFFAFWSLVGFTYSLSFWPVTPTPDARYHAFPVFAQCMFLSYMAARGCGYCWLHYRNSTNNLSTTCLCKKEDSSTC